MKTREKIKYIKAISDPTRLDVMRCLCLQECSVEQLINSIHIEPTLMSHHLSVLKELNLVIFRRKAKNVFYKLGPMANRRKDILRIADFLTVKITS